MSSRQLTPGRLLRRAVGRHRGRLAVAVSLTSIHQAAEAAVPIAIGVIIDIAVSTGDITAMTMSVAGLAALFVILTFAWRFGARQAVWAKENEAHQLRMEVTGRLLDPRGRRERTRSGELLTIATSDAQRAGDAVDAAVIAIAAVTGIAVSAAALLTIDPTLGLTVLLGVMVLVAAPQTLAPLMTRRSTAQQVATAGTTALATDLVTGLRTLRGVGAQHNAARRYRASSAATLGVTVRAASAAGVYQGLTAAVSLLFLAGVAGLGGWMAMTQRISVGELITVVGLAQFIAEPVKALGFAGQTLAAARGSAVRLVEVLNAPPRVEPGTDAADTARLSARNLTYGSLCGLDADVAPGEIIAINCADPGCATDVMELLGLRVGRDEYTGRLLLDGRDAGDLELDSARATLLAPPHDVMLFEGTLRDNVLAGTTRDDAEVRAALRDAAADDVADAYPAGLDHELAERGANLSGGQRQRLGLARALLAEAPVLVLHDPTTAVDAATEQLIAHGLGRRRRADPRSATILVTDSPALLDVADRVIVVREGRVAAAGTHRELVDMDRHYAETVLR